MKRAYVYIYGFNLYYRALRSTPHKWLNPQLLAESLLDSDNQVEVIRYFTAPVSGKFDAGVPVRQQRYLHALSSVPTISVHLGTFLTRPKLRPLVQSPVGSPTYVQVWNTEEKGSDVNLATYLMHDAWRDRFDVALVLSQDTDLNEPVRLVRDDLHKAVGVVVLDGKAPGQLATRGSFVRHLTDAHLGRSQFPNRVSYGVRGKYVEKPKEWL